MKARAYLFHVGKTHESIALGLCRLGNATIATFGRGLSDDVVRAIRAADSDVLSVESLCGRSEASEAALYAQQRAQLLRSKLLECPPAVPGAALPFDAERVFQALGPIETTLAESDLLLRSLDRLSEQFDVRGFVCSEDMLRLSRVAAQWARSRKARSFHIHHGLTLGGVPARTGKHIYGQFFTDYLFAAGPRGAEALVRWGCDPAKVVIAGSPAFDPYVELLGRQGEIRQEFRRMCGLPSDARIVVFAVTGRSEWTLAETDPGPATLEAFCAGAQRALAAGGSFAIVIKDRVSHGKTGKQAVDALLLKYGLRATYATGRAENVVCAADLVVAAESTMSFEAALCGVPTVNIWSPSSWLFGPYFMGSDGVPQYSCDQVVELGAEILCLINDQTYREKVVANVSAALPFVVHAPDGNAAMRCAEFVFARTN